MNELFKMAKSLSAREQWVEDNGVELVLADDKATWTARRGDDEKSAGTRARAIDELAFALRKTGVAHWREEGPSDAE